MRLTPPATTVEAPKEPPKKDRSPEARWTPALAKNGWTPVVDDFLDNYAELGITPGEAMLIVHLMRHKWDKNAPYPGFETLGRQMGITPTSVRNHVRSLEKKKLLVREMRVSQTNKFHLTPLFERLEKHVAAKPKKVKEPEFDVNAALAKAA